METRGSEFCLFLFVLLALTIKINAVEQFAVFKNETIYMWNVQLY